MKSTSHHNTSTIQSINHFKPPTRNTINPIQIPRLISSSNSHGVHQIHSKLTPPVLLLLATLLSATLADPDPLQDFCVADLASTAVTVNGFPCKPSSAVVSDDFSFSGLATSGNTTGMFGAYATLANVTSFPGLNTLGLTMSRADVAPGGFIPLHTHPLAAELVLVLEGELLVGFVSTANVFYSKVVKAGETFIIPMGLIHFQYNAGTEKATAIAAFNSQSPGVVTLPLGLFGSKPAIPDEVLAKTFQVDNNIVKLLKSKFGN